RSGKTTLAQAVAKELELPFVATSTSQVFKDLGLDPAKINNATDRQRVQDKILTTLEDQWSEYPEFVTDRTPLDLIAYTLTSGHLLLDDEWVEDYILECRSLLRRFSWIGLVPPSIALQEAELKASLTQVSIQQVHFLIRGLFDQYVGKPKGFILPFGRLQSTLENRINFTFEAIH